MMKPVEMLVLWYSSVKLLHPSDISNKSDISDPPFDGENTTGKKCD